MVRLEERDHQLEEFWSRWSSEYLKNLPPCRRSKVEGGVVMGSVVLVQEVKLPRLSWPMGVVVRILSPSVRMV